jgi:penicillin amidase
VFGDEWRGSNSWAVHGSKTASGFPLIASDPHLALTSPPLWWHFHLDTKRAGGDVSTAGLSLVGAPGVVLGFTEYVAWGSTVHGFDVTDIYLERITPGDPDTVEIDGRQVPIETVTEVIRTDMPGVEHVVEFELVPHHGLIIPGSRNEDGTEALSLRWTGNESSNELGAYLGLMRAESIEDVREALDGFEVGGQNFVMATRDGHIFWTTQVHLPTRDDRALTYDPATNVGASPCTVLDGTGAHEWTGRLSDRYLPHDLDPERGWIATANGDAVGVTADGNPFNDEHYLGCDFDLGYRIARITERLEELAARGGITVEDMSEVQSDAVSPLGRLLTTPIVAELNRAQEQLEGTVHEDLAAAVAEIGEERMGRILALRDRLAAWSYDTPHGVEAPDLDPPTEAEIDDSVATTIFNALYGRLMALAFQDEFDRGGHRTSQAVRTMQWALLTPEVLATYDAELGDTVLWDDISTAVVETRGERVLRAIDQTLTYLEGELGSDPQQWRWGRLHTLQLYSAFIPALGPDVISIPTDDDPIYPGGFPRHGDRYTVDVSNFSAFALDSFSYGSGPQQRFVAEMTPDGPRVVNALPGGQVLDPDDPHHADEMELWRRNTPQPIRFTEAEVVANAETRLRLVP